MKARDGKTRTSETKRVYPAWRDGEWRALDQWLQRTGRRFHVLGRGPKFSGAIRIA